MSRREICILVSAFVIVALMGCATYSMTHDWGAVIAIATLLLFFGVVFAALQFWQTRQSTNAQITVELIEKLRNADMLATIRCIYNCVPQEIKNLHSVDRSNIDNLIDKLDMLSLLAIQGTINKKLAISAYGNPTIMKCWFQLYDYVEHFRNERKYKWCRYLEQFAHIIYLEIKEEGDDKLPKFYRAYNNETINLKEAFKFESGIFKANYSVDSTLTSKLSSASK
jgi:hypothetical protein